MIKALFWSWILVLLFLNVIPIGNEANKAMKGNVFLFRLDYLVHTVFFLMFAWIYLVSRLAHRPIFDINGKLKVIIVSLCASVLFELVQMIIPYRAFNPYDMIANLAGSIIGAGIICLS